MENKFMKEVSPGIFVLNEEGEKMVEKVREEKHQISLVDPKNEPMAGDNELERKLNAYLTCQFVWCGDFIPDNECLTEAKDVIRMVREYDQKQKENERYDFLLAEIAETEGMLRQLPENAVIERQGIEHRLQKAKDEINNYQRGNDQESSS